MTVIDLIKADLEKNNKLEKYVILKKDDKGFYIEYAFKDGAPHDNRCLDWYQSYQEEAYIRNGWLDGLSEEDKQKRLNIIKKDRDSRVGKIYRLSSFTCGGEENPEDQVRRHKESFDKYHDKETEAFVPEDHICKVGCPAKACGWNRKWTYEQPVKCACWYLTDQVDPDEFIENYRLSIKAADLAELMNESV